MQHRDYTHYLQKELDFLKLLISRFHEQEKVNALELEIALEKTRDIYEQLLRIKLAGELKVADLPSAAPMPAPPVIRPYMPDNVDVSIQTRTEAPILPEVEARREADETRNESAPLHKEKKPQVAPAKPAILAEKIGALDFQPINETLAQQYTHGDLSTKLQTAPLRSISSGIGLNDKFLYIRELFGNDNALYGKTLQHLDAVNSLDEALNFIYQQFDWDKKNETVQKFINLLYRRHGQN